MPERRSDGQPKSWPAGRVKAESRASGSAKALALTRPEGKDIIKSKRSTLTPNTVAEERAAGARLEGWANDGSL